MTTITTKWSALGTYTTAIAGAAVAPTLKALASAGQKIGNAIDNTYAAGGYLYSDWDLLCRFASSPAAGAYCSLYLIPAVDSTNYTDGDDSVVPPTTLAVCTFPVRAVSTAQRVSARGVLLPPGLFKPLFVNNTAQNLTNTDNENILSYRFYTVISE